MSGRLRWLPWLALAVVALGALAIGAIDDGGPPSAQDRVRRIASGLRCPTCRSQSAQDSDAEAARAIRTDIAERVRSGQSDAQIRGYYVSRYGEDIILKPRGDGVAGLVWALPAAVLVAGGAGLLVAFRRWRPSSRTPTPEDRALVDRALGS